MVLRCMIACTLGAASSSPPTASPSSSLSTPGRGIEVVLGCPGFFPSFFRKDTVTAFNAITTQDTPVGPQDH